MSETGEKVCGTCQGEDVVCECGKPLGPHPHYPPQKILQTKPCPDCRSPEGEHSEEAREHELKSWPEFFSEVVAGRKRFELRKDDRGFRAGDTLHLREWLPHEKRYTGREARFTVEYVTSGLPWLQPGYVCMSIEPARSPEGEVSDDLAWAEEKLREHRQTHLDWAAWLEDKSGPPEVGDVEFHRATVRDYDRLHSVFRALRAKLATAMLFRDIARAQVAHVSYLADYVSKHLDEVGCEAAGQPASLVAVEWIKALRAKLEAAQNQAAWATEHLGRTWAALTGGDPNETLAPEMVESVAQEMRKRLEAAEREVVDVVAAVRFRDPNLRWVCKRSTDGDHAGLRGLWEYPGGKVEEGETHAVAVKREMREEFGVEASVGRLLARIESRYEGTVYAVHFYEVEFEGEPELRCHTAAGWFTPDELLRQAHLPSGTDFNRRLAARCCARHLALREVEKTAHELVGTTEPEEVPYSVPRDSWYRRLEALKTALREARRLAEAGGEGGG